jgi:ketosteroid isomerase-like protein
MFDVVWCRRAYAVSVLGVVMSTIGRPLHAQTSHNTSAPLDTASILATARAEIDSANAAWLPGLRHRDAQSIVAAYADSGLFIAGNGTVTRGRTAIASLYSAQFPRMREILAGGVVQDGLTAVSPTLIYEWGHAWVELAPAIAGGPPVRSGGSYLTVWQREKDGHWRIARNLSF